MLVGCCGIKRFRLIYPWEMEAQTDGRECKPSRAINHSRAALPALRLCRSPHSQRDRCSSLELCPCPIPWGGQTYHSPGVLHPGIIPAVLPARHSPEQGPTPGGDRGTKLQAQQVSHFPSLLSHIQGNVTPLGSFLEKRGSTVAAGMSLPVSRRIRDRTTCLELTLKDGCLAKLSTAQGDPNGLLMSFQQDKGASLTPLHLPERDHQ